MRSSEWVLTYMAAVLMQRRNVDTDTHEGRTPRACEEGHLQARERPRMCTFLTALKGSKYQRHLDLTLPASRMLEIDNKSVVQSTQFVELAIAALAS